VSEGREFTSERIRSALAPVLMVAWVGCGHAMAQELPRSGYLGVIAAPVSGGPRDASGPDAATGVRVQGLVDGGSAQASGIEPGDVIVQINDHKVTAVGDFIQFARTLKAGDTAAIVLRRGRQSASLQVPVQPRPYEAAPDVDVFYRTVSVDGSLRRVIVTAPKGSGKHPAVLYVNGIGCFSQESMDLSSPDAKLLYGLTRAGFVTMRVEKTGMGDSQGPDCSSPIANLELEIAGYVAGLRALKEYPIVDAANVFAVGISLGGVEGPLIAQREALKGLVVINTVAKPLFEYLLETLRRQKLLAHVPYDQMDRDMRLVELCNHRLLIERQTPEQILKVAPECAGHVTYPAPYTFMQQWAALDMAAEWKKVAIPVLIVYGTSDFVATAADHPYLAGMIDSFHPHRASLQSIAGMDHTMTRAASMQESFARLPGTRAEFQPAVLETIKTWLQSQSGTVGPAG